MFLQEESTWRCQYFVMLAKLWKTGKMCGVSQVALLSAF